MSELMNPNWISIPVYNTEKVLIEYKPIRYDQFVLKVCKDKTYNQVLKQSGTWLVNASSELNYKLRTSINQEVELDTKKVIELLGILRFNIQAIQNALGIPDNVVLQENGVKLSKEI